MVILFQVTATTQQKQKHRLIVGLVQWLEYWVVTPVIGFESLAHPNLKVLMQSRRNATCKAMNNMRRVVCIILDTDSKSLSPSRIHRFDSGTVS